MIELTLEQMDIISGKATIAMHKEFEEMGEEHLKELYGGISTGMVQHVVNALKKNGYMLVPSGGWEQALLESAEFRGELSIV